MSEAAMTPEKSGNDSVRPSLSLDDAMQIDFHDPDEDTNEVEQESQSESVTDEVEEDREAEEINADADVDDEAEAEEQGEEDEASTPEPGDDVSVTVNGQKLTLNELKRGYLREGDYTRKTQVVSQKEKDLESMSARVTKTVDAIADFLMQQIPAAPNPQLAITNPGQFVQQKALHEAAVQQLNALLAQAGEVKGVVGELTAEQKRELLIEENAKLAERFPATTNAEERKKFFDAAYSAAKELGYTEQDIKSVSDHRLFALAHYAALGMQAEKAREKAKQKVQNAPPVAPQKARPQGTQQAAARRNQDAMKKLARTGSIDDAMAIDFD